MAKICIMCAERAGAGEHTFPASMGGRRINRGLYCSTHEKQLGPLIAALSEQLRFFHAMLKIRHDRKDTAEPFEFTLPSGKRMIAFDGAVRWANPADEFTKEEINIPNTFGGPGSLKVIVYIALNLFGQHFQEDVRKPGLEAIKIYLREDIDNNFVWWEKYETFDPLPKNPFLFGHTVALTTCAKTGQSKALVSLFQSLNFGVDLGVAEGARDKSVVVVINPQAEPVREGDVLATTFDRAIVQFDKPQPLYKYLEEMIKSGDGQDGFQIFINRVERWKFDKDMGPEIDKLNAARIFDKTAMAEIVVRFLEHQGGRVYRLMNKTVEMFDETQDLSDPDIKIMSLAFHKAIEIDPNGVNKMTPYVNEVAQSVMHRFIEEMIRHLFRSELDVGYMWDLFSTGKGLGLVGEAMTPPIIEMLVAVKAGRARL